MGRKRAATIAMLVMDLQANGFDPTKTWQAINAPEIPPQAINFMSQSGLIEHVRRVRDGWVWRITPYGRKLAESVTESREELENIIKLSPKKKTCEWGQYGIICHRCGHQWISKSPNPWRCPKCNGHLRSRTQDTTPTEATG